MTIKLYDLCAADRDVRFSPYCWIVKFALLHKGLDFEIEPLNFIEKQKYPDPDYGKLPILVDDGEVICDSPVIVAHLEKKYPARPLVATDGERAFANFLTAWLGASVYPSLAPITFVQVHKILDDETKKYFRETREKRFGKTLEEVGSDPAAGAQLEKAFGVLGAALGSRQFLGGASANLCDYIAVSPLIWRRIVTPEPACNLPAPVDAWMVRMLDLFDGYARNAKRGRPA